MNCKHVSFFLGIFCTIYIAGNFNNVTHVLEVEFKEFIGTVHFCQNSITMETELKFSSSGKVLVNITSW